MIKVEMFSDGDSKLVAFTTTPEAAEALENTLRDANPGMDVTTLDLGAPDLPHIGSYGHYSSDNYGLNCLTVQVGSLRLYYSYQTIVAFYTPNSGLVCSKNVWTTTTGKHLNWIGVDRSRRVEYDVFCNKLNAALREYIR